MDLLNGTEYLFLSGCLESKPKYNIPESFAFIVAFRITQVHADQPSGDGETAVAAFG
jgi:hypothetical protein